MWKQKGPLEIAVLRSIGKLFLFHLFFLLMLSFLLSKVYVDFICRETKKENISRICHSGYYLCGLIQNTNFVG